MAWLKLSGEQRGQQICNAANTAGHKHEFDGSAAERGSNCYDYGGIHPRCPTKKINPSNLGRDASEKAQAPSLHWSANTVQCVEDAIEGVFGRIQAHAFAKSSPDTRTYLVCIHPTVPIRKQPKIWRS